MCSSDLDERIEMREAERARARKRKAVDSADRRLPYRYTRWGLNRFNRRDGKAIVYLHPWEIDEMQPRLRASKRSRLRQYRGLGTVETKLTYLLQDFRFAPISTVFKQELEELSHSGNSRLESLPHPESGR